MLLSRNRIRAQVFLELKYLLLPAERILGVNGSHVHPMLPNVSEANKVRSGEYIQRGELSSKARERNQVIQASLD